MIVQSSAAVSNMLTFRQSHNCFVPQHSEISHQNHAHDAKAVPKARHLNYTSLEVVEKQATSQFWVDFSMQSNIWLPQIIHRDVAYSGSESSFCNRANKMY